MHTRHVDVSRYLEAVHRPIWSMRVTHPHLYQVRSRPLDVMNGGCLSPMPYVDIAWNGFMASPSTSYAQIGWLGAFVAGRPGGLCLCGGYHPLRGATGLSLQRDQRTFLAIGPLALKAKKNSSQVPFLGLAAWLLVPEEGRANSAPESCCHYDHCCPTDL